MQDVGRSASPRIALALACLALVGVFLLLADEDQSFLESSVHLHPKHEGAKSAAVPHIPKPLPVPKKPSVTEEAMVRCNGCRKKLEDACRKAGGFPKCQHVPVVHQQFAQCQKQGITLSGNTLMCPGDKQTVPVQVKCNECRARLTEKCNKYGGYPNCQMRKLVQHQLSLCPGLAVVKGVLVCPGDAKISPAVECRACRFDVVTKCSHNGGFPQCLSSPQVRKAYAKCSQQGGLKRLPETKALTCPGEQPEQLDSKSAICDACRDKLQGECSKWSGYPSCLKAAVVKATLKDCRKRRFLTLVKGRLFCEGDNIVKPHHIVAPKVDVPHKSVRKKPVKKHVAARKVVKNTKASPERSPIKPNKKLKPRVPARQVVMPPPGLTCEKCRNHLTATCKRLGGKRGMALCEHDPRYKRIFKKIRNSCMKFRGLIQHKDGSLGCPLDKVRIKAKRGKQQKPQQKAQVKKSRKKAPLRPSMPPSPIKKKATKHRETTKVKKGRIVKQNNEKVASAQKAATVTNAIVKKRAQADVAAAKKTMQQIATQDKRDVASAQKAATMAHNIRQTRRDPHDLPTPAAIRAKVAAAEKTV